MIIIEGFLLALIVTVLSLATVSDILQGIVSNKLLLFAAIIVAVINVFYYSIFSGEFFVRYLINFLIMFVVCVLFYVYNVWAAGDSKLLIFVLFAMPSRVLYLNSTALLPGFMLLAIIFIIAFCFVIADSVVCGIKEKNIFSANKFQHNWKAFFMIAVYIFFAISIFNAILQKLLPKFLLSDASFVLCINMLFILTLIYFDSVIKQRLVIILAIVWIALLGFGFISFQVEKQGLIAYILSGLVFIARYFADKYNYRMIETSQIKKGMILSFMSVMCFSGSKVAGLPTVTTEDLRSRLSDEQVSSIHKWGLVKCGRERIQIVKKIPFAIFIAIGTILFILMEVL